MGFLVEAQKVADDPAVQQCPVGVSVSKIGGLQLHISQFIEDGLRDALLLVAESAEVKDGQ